MKKIMKITSLLAAIVVACSTFSGFAVSADFGRQEVASAFSKADPTTLSASPSYSAYVSEDDNRNRVVSIAQSYLGIHESTARFREEIIDEYNRLKPADLYRMDYDSAWCACFYSLVALKSGFSDIFPLGVGCTTLMRKYKEAGRFSYRDSYSPRPGDACFYTWSGSGPDSSDSDHIGIVESVSGNTMTVIEGNYSDSVKRRTVKTDSSSIVGYGRPDYASKARASEIPGTVYTAEESFFCYVIRRDIWRHLEVRETGEAADRLELSAANNDVKEAQLFHFKRNDDGTYTIFSALNGKAVDVHCASSDNGTPIELYAAHFQDNQRFFLYLQEDGSFVLKAKYTDKVWDVCQDSKDPGAGIILYDFTNGNNQRFALYVVARKTTEFSSGYYNLLSDGGKKVAACGDRLRLTSRTSNDASTVFYLSEQRDGTYALVVNNKGVSLDGAYFCGQPIVLSPYKANLFEIYRYQDEYGRGRYFLKPIDSEMPMDIAGASEADSTPLQLWHQNNTVAQKLRLVKV